MVAMQNSSLICRISTFSTFSFVDYVDLVLIKDSIALEDKQQFPFKDLARQVSLSQNLGNLYYGKKKNNTPAHMPYCVFTLEFNSYSIDLLRIRLICGAHLH